MKDLPIIPGRGLNTHTARALRHNYLKEQNIDIDAIANFQIDVEQLHHNIESFIGSVEVPLGIVGPLLFKGDTEELVYCAAGTNEGALVASMNRGARAISLCGGFEAAVLHQKMVRSPLFIFNKLSEAISFKEWTMSNLDQIKSIAEQYSNHAHLLDIQDNIIGKSIHLKFVYETDDASGQNMTTTCTWHAMLWMAEHFQSEKKIEIVDYVLEGNGASDKKVSNYSSICGRGIHVVAECFISNAVLQKVLRITASDLLRFYTPSLMLSKLDGMSGYSINVANAIAAIFVATGQDLGSLHESSVGVLNLEPSADGIYLSLNLPSLVIGTVGGGTHISKQREALEIMRCYGSDKVIRFAQLIAGFALSLEISTYAAIVSGGFAKAHEKLGRNKPINWLLKSEINKEFIQKHFSSEREDIELVNIDSDKRTRVDNGILSNLTAKISKKLIGFVTANITYRKNNEVRNKRVLLKSKATDLEVIKGLHLLASAIDIELADLINQYKDILEYSNSHLKEISIYDSLSSNKFKSIPKYHGKVIEPQREIYLFAMEVLESDKMAIMDSENRPGVWTKDDILNVLRSIDSIHKHFLNKPMNQVTEFEPWKAIPLYNKLLELYKNDLDDSDLISSITALQAELPHLKTQYENLGIKTTIIHNDFNTRNIAIRKDGRVCIYDWELATINIPHHDIVEFLCFVLPVDFDEAVLLEYLGFHYQINEGVLSKPIWFKGYAYALKELIITRLSFYEVSGIIVKYNFSNRVMLVALRMLKILE